MLPAPKQFPKVRVRVGFDTSFMDYCTQEISGKGKIGKFGVSWTICQNFPRQYSKSGEKMYLVYALTVYVAYSPNFPHQ